MDDNSGAGWTSHREKYRMAGRTLRYELHLGAGIVWAFLAIYSMAQDIFWPAGLSAVTVSCVYMVLLALMRGGSLILLQPWQALKAICVGAIIFFAVHMAKQVIGLPSNPYVLSTIMGSALYLKESEAFTTHLALAAWRRMSEP